MLFILYHLLYFIFLYSIFLILSYVIWDNGICCRRPQRVKNFISLCLNFVLNISLHTYFINVSLSMLNLKLHTFLIILFIHICTCIGIHEYSFIYTRMSLAYCQHTYVCIYVKKKIKKKKKYINGYFCTRHVRN